MSLITLNDIEKFSEFIEVCSNRDVDFNSIVQKIHGKINIEDRLDSLFISGGATRFVGLGSAAIRLYQLGYNPKVLGGISAGSIILLPLVMGLHEEIIKYGSTATHKNIFDISPTNKKGNISWNGVFRSIFGHYSFGIQNIKPLLQKVITKEVFAKYQQGDYPDLYIMAVNANTGERKLWNLKNDCYTVEDYYQFVMASSRIPIMTQAEWVNDQPYFDGGLRNHIPTTKVLSERNDIGKIISIYARPQDFKEIDKTWEDNIIRMIMRSIRIMSIEISKKDEREEKLLSFIKGIELKQLFLPKISDSLYDVTPEKLEKLRLAGINIVDKNIGEFI